MTTKTDKKDPGEWGGLVSVHAFARPVLAGTGDRGCVFARPATASMVINGLITVLKKTLFGSPVMSVRLLRI